ncbi:spore coat protein [Brevibacillus fluminis]|uniref:Spore coat protein n=1 Tax=Brevibacillus fluminis TaxID=511487 RepID=A0A3M8CXW5_9BACL|nr:spore coat protein [Brevibacillus fluminis]RNB79715.1 spore coat protein [Brevibacillus fluminis]
MAAQMGAHEVMELHEVLSGTINAINHFELYRPYVKDPQLMALLDRHLQFMTQEYNNLAQAVNQQGMGAAMGVPYRAPKMMNPVMGLHQPKPQHPNASAHEMNDEDVSCAMLGCHKASASMQIVATQEIVHPQLRRMVQQGAVNCSEMSYEVFQYMNQKGYYQVPTLADVTTNTATAMYQPTTMVPTGMQPAPMQQMMQAPMMQQPLMQNLQQPYQTHM